MGIIVFVNFTERLHDGRLESFDNEISDLLFSLRTDSLNNLFRGITSMGNVTAYAIQLPIIFVILYRYNREWAKSIEAMMVLLSAFLLNISLKIYFGRIRPDESLQLIDLTEGSFSYPSGHSMTAIAFYGFLIYLINHYSLNGLLKSGITILLVTLIFFIGLSRIYLGAHYPSDVIAGYVAGSSWLLICIAILRSYQYRVMRQA